MIPSSVYLFRAISPPSMSYFTRRTLFATHTVSRGKVTRQLEFPKSIPDSTMIVLSVWKRHTLNPNSSRSDRSRHQIPNSAGPTALF